MSLSCIMYCYDIIYCVHIPIVFFGNILFGSGEVSTPWILKTVLRMLSAAPCVMLLWRPCTVKLVIYNFVKTVWKNIYPILLQFTMLCHSNNT